jgi:hypothetical protein
MDRLNKVRFSCLALACVLVSGACADDWLMFRKDGSRSASSSDKVTLPMKPIWSSKGQRVNGVSVVSTVTVRDGMLYYFTGSPMKSKNPKTQDVSQRTLVCADAKTGVVRWSQPMVFGRMQPYLSEDIGPAVSASGIVYALDFVPINTCPGHAYGLKAFSADKGKLLGQQEVSLRDPLSRFFLREGHDEPNFLLQGTQKPFG